MSYLFSSATGWIREPKELTRSVREHMSVHARGLTEEQSEALVVAYGTGKLTSFLDGLEEHEFVAVLADSRDGSIVAINDKFGSNQLFYALRHGAFWLTDDLKLLYETWHEQPTIDVLSAYEHLEFHSVRPPRTIFNEVNAVPMASMTTFVRGAHDVVHERYWDVARRLRDKETEYPRLIMRLRKRFEASLAKDLDQGTGVSLSGGIDSGGILAVLTKLAGRPIPSVSFGGHGKGTPDLESSRQTAAELGSPNTEIYPSLAVVARLAEFSTGLNQPVLADALLPNRLIFAEAARRGVGKIAFGLGAEMLLGNLKIARAAAWVAPAERFLPRFVTRALFTLYGRAAGLSENQREFLAARSWEERFLYARGPLFTRSRRMYAHLPVDFFERLTEEVRASVPPGLPLNDRFVCMYLFSWVNYLQRRDMGALSNPLGVLFAAPFDTPEVAEELFRTSTRFRRMNGWNKQVIRDLFRPYLSDRLYHRVVRSLIVSYTRVLAPVKVDLITYLKTSPVIRSLVDMERYEREYATLPEPGLNLMRLFGLAAWYDANWNTANLPAYEKVAEALRKAHIEIRPPE